MQEFLPTLLSRKKAMNFMGLGRKALENLATKRNVRLFVTKGGHKRYFRDDLIQIKNEQIQTQQG